MQNKGYIRWAWATLIVIFLVILAGSLVRMTGSGMGCPDWPRCFGYLIPPTELEQVLWQPDKAYFEGQMIVHEDVLYESKVGFTSTNAFNASNWAEYTQHDYATFNAKHTWIEYINRLIGALSGLFALVLFFWTALRFFKQKSDGMQLFLAFFLLPLLGFQAWLGKTVVDSNLAPAKITAHMFGALAIVAVLLYLIKRAQRSTSKKLHKSVQVWALLAFVLVLVQIYLGTGVRQYVDLMVKYPEKSWLGDLSLHSQLIFKLHRSFAWVVLASCGWLIYKARQAGLFSATYSAMLIVLVLEVVVGIVLAWLELPAPAKPAHLMLASILFSLLFWVLIGQPKDAKAN
ncbi:MAG: COX15/CtaA family protein [Saprospiraceae bacterium]|nr:COX15/CtaA family protein [Saprospiraceae bacterium]